MLQTFPLAPVRLASGIRAREAWSLDANIVHLNHGSFGAVPTEVIEYQDALRAQAHRSALSWFPRVPERMKAARAEVAPFLGATADNAVFVPNASAAATVVYNSLRLEATDEILVTNHGYGSVTLGATRLATRFGARVRTVKIPLLAEANEVLSILGAALSARTRLLIVDHITSPTARLFPVAAITTLAHSRGIRVLVDGAHAAGLIPEAATAGGDWWFGNLHKWPCAPRGAAMLVAHAEDRQDLWPLIDSWGALKPFPERFDAQGTVDATAYLSAPAAIDFIEREFGWQNTRTTISALADDGAALIGDALQPYVSDDVHTPLPDPAPSMRLLRLPDGVGTTEQEADALRSELYDEVGVEATCVNFDGVGYFRLSAHLYTETSDFEAFIERCIPALVRRMPAARS